MPDISEVNGLSISSLAELDSLLKSQIAAFDGLTIPASGGAFLLDQSYASGAAAAYSIRRLKSSTGALIRVRRVTGVGNTGNDDEADFSYDSNNELSLNSPISNADAGVNSTTLGSFLNVGTVSGVTYPDTDSLTNTAEGYCDTWYDQSGNSNDATQSTPGSQPAIHSGTVNTGLITENGKPALKTVSAEYLMFTSITFNSDFCFVNVQTFDIGGTGYGGAAGNFFAYGVNSTNLRLRCSFFQSDFNIPTTTNGTQYLATHNRASGSLNLHYQGVDRGSANNAGTANLHQIMAGNTTGFLSLNGYTQELILWSSDKSSNRSGIEGNVNNYYTIYGFGFTIDTSLGDGTAAFHLPLSGTVNFTVDWGDGNSDTITSSTDPAMDHTYATGGTYTINLEGTIGTWNSGTTTDKTKVTDITNWGSFTAGSCNGFTNLTSDSAPNYPKVSSLSSFFRSAPNFNGDISNWDVSNVTSFGVMFFGASSFNRSLNNWDVSSGLSFNNMFRNATVFNGDITSWDVSNVGSFERMFDGARAFNQPIGAWTTTTLSDCREVFEGAIAFNQSLNNWDVSNVTTMRHMFAGASAFNGDISSWDVSSVTNMNSMFQNASAFNQNIGSWNVANVSNMEGMFLGASSFNQNINSWNVASVTSMVNAFRSSSFNQNINSWNVASVTSMAGIFSVGTSNPNCTSWNTGSVTSMAQFAQVNTAFNQDLSGWDMSSVTNFFEAFDRATSFNADISGWDTSSATSFKRMFHDNTFFNRDLGSWNIGVLTNAQEMIDGSGLSTSNYDALLIGWAAQAPNIQSNVTLSTGPQYTSAAASARNVLTSTYNWTITDGGQV